MADGTSETLLHPQVVLDLGEVWSHVLPLPRLVAKHFRELIEVPFVWNKVDECIVDRTAA